VTEPMWTAEKRPGPDDVIANLGMPAGPWLDDLTATDAPERPVRLPAGDEALRLLAELAVPAEDATEALAAQPDPERDPELWWLLERCHQRLASGMGGWSDLPWPSVPAEYGPVGRFFYLWVFVSAVPAVRRYHRERGVSDEVSRDTLADLGDKVAIHRRIHGAGGLETQFWFTLHFRGVIYALGRLQFNLHRVELDDDARADPALADRVPGFTSGDVGLGVHIPETGAMTPESCDASLAAAREFFPRHFPEYDLQIATCSSWLLDEQLADYLPDTSNIVAFQRRFHLTPGGHDGDRAVFEFVFRRVRPNLDELPQRTTPERAVVSHLRSGRHWQSRLGWIAL
jgi:hypothetical protein